MTLKEKAKQAFKASEHDFILTGQGLTRKELRQLERRGIVRKLETFKTRKYTDVTPAMIYAWELVEEK